MVISACQHACPAGIDVPNYVAAVAMGNYEKAVDIIRERNPFPAVCGRICIHPCEFKCRRGELDDPVAIRSLKRFAADWYFENIGTQPIGGGMLGITIPEFRLPREIIQKEIYYIESCGVEIHYDTPIDARHTVNDLMEEGYSAVFIAPGAQASMRMGILGEDKDIEGLYYGLRFLADIKTEKEIELNGKVIVIGGGNVAIDVARTALRVGASGVQIFYRRTVEEMPAWEKDIEEAIEEGVVINALWAPKMILHQNNKITGIEFARSETVFDEAGGSRLSVDDKKSLVVDADAIIISIGQAPDSSFLSKDSQIERSLWGGLEVNNNTLSTNIPGIFAGGDFTTGPSTVIEAIASGRRAAIAIEKYLQKDSSRIEIIDEKTSMQEDAGLALDEESSEEKPRISVDLEQPEKRVKDFREVEKGFSEKNAIREAVRCLRCDLEEERR